MSPIRFQLFPRLSNVMSPIRLNVWPLEQKVMSPIVLQETCASADVVGDVEGARGQEADERKAKTCHEVLPWSGVNLRGSSGFCVGSPYTLGYPRSPRRPGVLGSLPVDDTPAPWLGWPLQKRPGATPPTTSAMRLSGPGARGGSPHLWGSPTENPEEPFKIRRKAVRAIAGEAWSSSTSTFSRVIDALARGRIHRGS